MQQYFFILISLLIHQYTYASLGIGAAQLDSLANNTSITIDYESMSLALETGFGVSIENDKALHGDLDVSHDTYLTSYIGMLTPLFKNLHSCTGARVTYHIEDLNNSEEKAKNEAVDLGLYSGLKYELAAHVMIYSRVEPISYHQGDTVKSSLHFFQNAMTGFILHF